QHSTAPHDDHFRSSRSCQGCWRRDGHRSLQAHHCRRQDWLGKAWQPRRSEADPGTCRISAKGTETMTMATTDIRIDYTMLPESFDLSRKDAIIEAITTELRQGKVSAYAM